METQKTILLAALFFLTYLMWQSWNETFPDRNHINDQVKVSGQIQSNTTSSSSMVPNVTADTSGQSGVQNYGVNDTSNQASLASTNQYTSQERFVTVTTDTVEYKINLIGGDITQVKLLKYNKSLEDKTPLELINSNQETLFIAPNGLTGLNGPDTQDSRAVYKTSQANYKLSKLDKELKVDLVLDAPKGADNKSVNIVKSFIFKTGEYAVDVSYNVENNSNNMWRGNIFSVLKRKEIATKSGTFLSPAAYSGLAVYNTEENFHKISADKLSSTAKTWDTTQGWAAMVQQYFLSTWVPNANESYKYIAKSNNDGTYMITLIGPELIVAPGTNKSSKIKFYAGPEQAERLEMLAPGLNRTVDYGIMWPVASVIFTGMKMINSVVSNWGWSIILVTILIKILFYRLSSSSYKSMARLRVLSPKIEQLRKRYGDDREKMGKAMMELYQKEKVNPLGGCLPMLIQLPFFIALYWVIIESVELRQAPFVLWISDLSVKDPFYILPILMGISMLAQQKLSPAPTDPTQAKVMMMMPVVFTILFMYFPAGLVLYWVVNTVTSILQQWWITNSIENQRTDEINKKKTKNQNKPGKLDIRKLGVNKKALNASSYN